MSINLTVNGQVYSYPEQGDTNWGADATDWASAVTTGMLQKSGGLFQLLAELDFGSAFGVKALYYKSRATNVASAGALRFGNADQLTWRNFANTDDLFLGVNSSDELVYNNGVISQPVQTAINPLDTDSIDLTLSGGSDLSADLNLSSASAGGTNLKITNTIESDGLLSVIAKSDGSTNGYLSSADWTTFNGKQAAGNYITELTGDVVATGPGSVAAQIQAGVITNAMVNAAAAIAYSKLNLSSSIVNADVSNSAAIQYSKLTLSNSIVNADVAAAAAIALSKLAALTINRALVSDGSGVITPATTTATEIGYVNGVTSSIQTQLDAKQARSTLTTKGDLYVATASGVTTRVGVGTDGQVLTADSGQTEGMRWSTISASGGINYITNPNASATISPWVAYADAAGSIPVDGTGGSPSVTVTRDTNSLTIGTTSILLTKGAANLQGEGASIDFSISTALKNCPVQISTFLAASANFVFGSIDGVTPSDVTVYVYDVTNSTLLGLFPKVITSNLGQFTGAFQATSSTSYRLIFHIGTTNSLAWTLALGEVVATPLDSVFIQSDSDWVSYTPTFTGFGSTSLVNFKYKKEGPDIIISGIFTANTGTATEARISMPTGLVSSSGLPTLSQAGDMLQDIASASYFRDAALIEPNVNYMTFGRQTSTVGVFSKSLGNNLISVTSRVVAVTARVPIQGWTSGYATPAVSAQNVPVTFRAFKNGGAVGANATIATWTTVEKDSVGAFSASTGIYTVKVPGDYFVVFNWRASTSTADAVQIYKNSTAQGTSNNASSGLKNVSAMLVNCAVGDTITVRSTAALTTASTDDTNLEIFKVVDPSAFINIPNTITYTADVSSAGVISNQTSSFGTQTWLTGSASISNTSTYALTFVSGLFPNIPQLSYSYQAAADGSGRCVFTRVAATTSGVSVRVIDSSAASASATAFTIIAIVKIK